MPEHTDQSYNPTGLLTEIDEYCGQLTAEARAEAVELALTDTWTTHERLFKTPCGQLAKLGKVGIQALGDDYCMHHPKPIPYDRY